MRVVITGSRGWRDTGLIANVADLLPPRSTVVVGGALGADRMFEGAARIRGHEVIVMRADWSRGKGAGFDRNIAMLETGPDLVIAFWLGFSPGTRHTIRETMKRGIPLDLHWRPAEGPV